MQMFDSIQRRGRIPSVLVAGAIVVLGLTLVSLAFMVVRGLDEARMLRGEVVRSYETRSELQQVLSLHQDLETAQRGYQLTRDAAYLAPYSIAASQIDETFARLERSLLAQSGPRPRLTTLRHLSLKKRQFVDRVIALARGGQTERALGLVTSGQGKVMMDALRAEIASMERSERMELELRSERATAAQAWALRLSLGLTLALFVVLIVAIWIASKSYAAGKDAYRRLEDNRLRLAAILNGAQDGMIVLNPSGSIESLNPAASRMFGYDPEELVRKDVGVLFEMAPDRGRVETFLKRLDARRDGHRSEVQEFFVARKDGSTFPAEVALSPVRRGDGTSFLAVARDVSERKLVEEMKSEFVSTVSHELRTPLTSIAGSLGLILGGAAGTVPDRALRLVEIAQNNCNRLVRLINDILDIEKIESGKMRFEIRTVPLAPFLDHAVQANRGFAQEHGIDLRLEPVPAEAAVLADEDRLMQVMANLLSNAAKFSPTGETVTVSVRPLDRRYRISVADRGPGITDEFRGRIFGKFAQAESAMTRKKGGTGLGLSIVKEIVARMRGSVSFDTAPDEGTAFHVDLPSATLLSDVDDVAQLPEPTANGGLRILHVDDDADMLRVVASCFAGEAEVYSTPSAIEARAGILRQPYDAVILDIGLEHGSGLELMPMLRKGRVYVPVVIFTAQDVAAEQVAGADKVLVKSRASLDVLREEVLRLAREARAARAQGEQS